MQRCAWANCHPLAVQYHDAEWGQPLHDDKIHFEYLCLEVMQCGLSWLTILKKREAMRAAFDGFDYEKIARYDEEKIRTLLGNPEIIRSAGKIRALVGNAQRFMDLQAEFGSFDAYFWAFVDNKTMRGENAAFSPASERISRDLKKRGFKYLGKTVIYAHMQTAGLINDHDACCFKYPLLAK